MEGSRGRAAHLMVPVGEGTGLTRLRRSGSGMWILSGEICGYSGRSGDAGASSWGNSAVNWILMAVLGNRSVHLRQEGAGEAGTQARGALPPSPRLASRDPSSRPRQDAPAPKPGFLLRGLRTGDSNIPEHLGRRLRQTSQPERPESRPL